MSLLFAVFIMVILACLVSLKDVLHIQKDYLTYKREHKFDSTEVYDYPPTAKCYCKDCKNRFAKTCEELDIWVTDDFFCKSAEPSNYVPDLQGKEGMK